MKGGINKIFDFLLTYNFFVFFVYVSVLFLFVKNIKHHAEIITVTFIYLSNLLLLSATYTLNKSSDTEEDLLNSLASKQKKKLIYISSFLYVLSFILLTINHNHINISSYFYWIIIFVISVLYSYPKKTKLKKIFLLKNILPAAAWAISFYILKNVINVNNNDIIVIFFLILFIEIIWDMPDIKGDYFSKIKTLPVVFGFEKIRIFLLILLSIFFTTLNTINSRIVILMMFIFLLNTSRNTPKKYYHLLIFFIALSLLLL